MNYFQPSFQLLAKSRNGSSVTKRYSKPATPCERLLERDDVSEETKRVLRKGRLELDPVSLSIARTYGPVVARVIEPPCGPVDGLLSPLGLRVNHLLSVEQGPGG